MLVTIISAIVLSLVAPGVVHAQMNPAQAIGIAEGIAGIVFGSMYPAPRCGPHDAIPQPYQPPPPRYAPPPRPEQHTDLDDDDTEPLAPPPRRLNPYSLQPQTHRNAEKGQTTDLRNRDDGQQPADETAVNDDEEQPVQTQPRHQPVRRHYPPAQTIGQSQSQGQVAEIPSQPRLARPPSPEQ